MRPATVAPVLGLALIAVGCVWLLPPVAAAAPVILAVVVAGLVARRGIRRPGPTPGLAPAPGAPPNDATGTADADLRPLLDLIGDGVLLLDERETVLLANRAAARILARPRESMEGVSLIRASREYALVQLLREAPGEVREVVLVDRRVVEASATALSAAPARVLLTIHDLTPLRTAERARADLVANISHELRTPIAAARALAETLEAGVEEAEPRERFLRQLTEELERLGEMVERLLRLSRLESHAEEFTVEPVAIDALIAEAFGHMTPVAGRANVALLPQPAPDSGAVVLADRERVLEVLTNLLDNAIRYTPPGGTVRVDVTATGAMVRCCVRDQGPGILPAERARVFERFYTTDRARGSGAGTGLGLAIARHIVSRLAGEIWVAEETPGATLCFTLPRADAGPH